MKAREIGQDPFRAVEARIAVMRENIEDFPHQYVILNRLVAHVHKGIQDRYHTILKPLGINYSTYTVLMMLYGTQDHRLTPSDLAGASGEKPTNITRICDELLELGLIDRQPSINDRRRIEITLTRKGRQFVEKLQPQVYHALNDLYADFSATELKQLNVLLRKQLASIEPGS